VCCCRLYRERISVSGISHYAAPGYVTFQQAMLDGTFTETRVGEWFGPTYVHFCHYHHLRFPSDLGLASSTWFSPSTCSRREPLGIIGTGFTDQISFWSHDHQCQNTEGNSDYLPSHRKSPSGLILFHAPPASRGWGSTCSLIPVLISNCCCS